MATMGEVTHERVMHHEMGSVWSIVTGGSIIEAVAGIAAVVLTILALVGVAPADLAPIATIVIGVALLIEGGAIAARYSTLLSKAGGEYSTAELGGGMSAELLGGAGGGVLGLLALLGLTPQVLMSVAVIVFGAALLLGSGVTSRVSSLAIDTAADQRSHLIAREAVLAAAGAQALVGLAAVALGIIALVGISPMILTLVALLALGASILMSGTAMGGTIATYARR